MLATFRIGGVVEWGSSKFGGPDDQGVLEQAALFEILEQCGDRLIDVLC